MAGGEHSNQGTRDGLRRGLLLRTVYPWVVSMAVNRMQVRRVLMARPVDCELLFHVNYGRPNVALPDILAESSLWFMEWGALAYTGHNFLECASTAHCSSEKRDAPREPQDISGHLPLLLIPFHVERREYLA